MGVLGLHAGKALVRLGCMTLLEVEDGGGCRRTARGTPALEDNGGGRVWRRGFPTPARGSAAMLDWDPCIKPFGAPGEVRPGELTGGGRGACVCGGEGLYPRSCTCSHCAKREKKAGEI